MLIPVFSTQSKKTGKEKNINISFTYSLPGSVSLKYLDMSSAAISNFPVPEIAKGWDNNQHLSVQLYCTPSPIIPL